jgi:hypothetical protein
MLQYKFQAQIVTNILYKALSQGGRVGVHQRAPIARGALRS